MSRHPIHTVDVFAQGKYTGNQLAVIRDADDLAGDEMQSIAQEMNYSETTFVLDDQPAPDGFRVRIFTPAAELPFAGHPTLGTAHVIRTRVLEEPSPAVDLDLDVGTIPVTVEPDPAGEVYWMDQIAPEFGGTVTPERAASLVGASPGEVETDHPCQVVSTGVEALMVPLTSLDAVQGLEPDRERLLAYEAESGVACVLAFSTEAIEADHDLHARMFAPALGVLEDPATGSANGALAAYLSRHECLGGSRVEATVEQGYEIGRPSLLFLEAEGGSTIDVSVGGRVSPVLDGELL